MNMDVLFSHLKSHNIFVCSTCDIRCDSAKELTAHSKIHKQKHFSCSKCDYTATTLSKLNTHMRRHSEEKINECSITNLEKSPTSKTTPPVKNQSKRDLSVSPDTVNKNTKSLRNNSKEIKA